MVMSCICCAMAGVSAGNTQMAWGLKSPGSFFTHMFDAQRGWLKLAGNRDKGTDMWTLCVAWALRWLDSEKEQAESKCCKKMDAPREASWLFLTFTGRHTPLLLPPRSKGRGNRAYFLMKMQPTHTEEEHVGWEMLPTILIFRRYSFPHIGFQQQGYISCSYKVFCRSRQFSKADVLLLA